MLNEHDLNFKNIEPLLCVNKNDTQQRIAEKESSRKIFLENAKNTREQLTNVMFENGARLTREEIDQEKLCYFYRKSGNKGFILFSGNFATDDLTRDRNNNGGVNITLDYASLIIDAFSIGNIDQLHIYAPFINSYHAQFMEMGCLKEQDGGIKTTLKIVDSQAPNKNNCKDDAIIREIFATKRFTDRKISLDVISHPSLGIQSNISGDCNVFTNAFLYLKWKFDINPEDIKNYYLLHETMKLMVDRGVVYYSPVYPTTTLESTCKTIGKWQRDVLDHEHRTLPRLTKLCTYKAVRIVMEGTYSLIAWSISKIRPPITSKNALYRVLKCRNWAPYGALFGAHALMNACLEGIAP